MKVVMPERGILMLFNPLYSFNKITPASLLFWIAVLFVFIGIIFQFISLIKVGLVLISIFAIAAIIFVIFWLKGIK